MIDSENLASVRVAQRCGYREFMGHHSIHKSNAVQNPRVRLDFVPSRIPIGERSRFASAGPGTQSGLSAPVGFTRRFEGHGEDPSETSAAFSSAGAFRSG